MDNLSNASVSALTNHFDSGHYGVADKTGVIVTEVYGYRLVQISAWPQTLSQVGEISAQTIDSNKAPGPGQSIRTDNGILLRHDPLKWWLLTEEQSVVNNLSIDPHMGSTLDLSHSRIWLKISGDRAATLLNHFLPIDFRSARFTDGTVLNAAFHHIGISLYYTGSEFNLFLPRSFALSLWELLYESALQYGLEVSESMSFKH